MSETADRAKRSGSATTAPPTSRLAVLGSPIAHSKSPAIHAAAYGVLGLDWSYGREELQAADLEAFLGACGDDRRGFSVTMPLKEEAHRLARVLDPVADESGVVNTLLRLSGGAGWAGFNTDVGGLAAAIAAAGLDASSTVVIGSGATAVSALLAARRLGADRVHVVARNAGASQALVERFDGTSETGSETSLRVVAHPIEALSATPADTPLGDASLVISTLPGAAGSAIDAVPGLARVPLFDVAYDPWPSPLASLWRAAGGEAHAGEAMLLEQAVLQVRVFLRGDPSIPLEREAEVRAAMRAAIEAAVRS